MLSATCKRLLENYCVKDWGTKHLSKIKLRKSSIINTNVKHLDKLSYCLSNRNAPFSNTIWRIYNIKTIHLIVLIRSVRTPSARFSIRKHINHYNCKYHNQYLENKLKHQCDKRPQRYKATDNVNYREYCKENAIYLA